MLFRSGILTPHFFKKKDKKTQQNKKSKRAPAQFISLSHTLAKMSDLNFILSVLYSS